MTCCLCDINCQLHTSVNEFRHINGYETDCLQHASVINRNEKFAILQDMITRILSITACSQRNHEKQKHQESKNMRHLHLLSLCSSATATSSCSISVGTIRAILLLTLTLFTVGRVFRDVAIKALQVRQCYTTLQE